MDEQPRLQAASGFVAVGNRGELRRLTLTAASINQEGTMNGLAAHLVSIQRALHQLADVVEHCTLGGGLAEDLVEVKVVLLGRLARQVAGHRQR